MIGICGWFNINSDLKSSENIIKAMTSNISVLSGENIDETIAFKTQREVF